MEIQELKNNIINKNIDGSFKIFVYKDESSKIIINQYIKRISKILNLRIQFIEDINEIPDESFILDDNLYIINKEDWNIKDSHDNCIVVCKKTKDDRAILFPSLEDWQVIDYVIPKVEGIEKERLENIIVKYNKNYFKFLNDIDKISIFNKNVQNEILDLMINDKQFKSLSNFTIWDLSTAIIQRDVNKVNLILSVIDYIDVDALGLTKTLYTNFRSIVSIQSNPHITYNDLGISDKQFFVIKKYNCGFYTNKELIKIIELLTSIEYMFKFGEIQFSDLIDYIIVKILGVKVYV